MRIRRTPYIYHSAAKGEANIHLLRYESFSETTYLDATLVMAHFNFANRLVIEPGIELEGDPGADDYD